MFPHPTRLAKILSLQNHLRTWMYLDIKQSGLCGDLCLHRSLGVGLLSLQRHLLCVFKVDTSYHEKDLPTAL
jgi:hypothetical protein